MKRVIPSAQWAAITLVAAFIFALLLIRTREQSHPPAPPSPAPIIVEVQGDVPRPGVHLLSGPTGTVSDALTAAGWSPPQSARPIPRDIARTTVQTGNRIRVLHRLDAPPEVSIEDMDAASRLTMGFKLDLNQASREDLLLVPRMKPEWAEAIVGHRLERPWKSVDELQQIPGIGPKTVEKWRRHLEILHPGQP